MEMSGQFHTPATLYPWGKTQFPLVRRLGGPQDVVVGRKKSCLCWESNPTCLAHNIVTILSHPGS